MLSPNNFKLKPIIILGKIKHNYSMVDENLKKSKKIVW
jgi:hypothetical protein